MNVSQKTFIGWSLALLPIIMTALYMFVFIRAGDGDSTSVLKNVAENALLNKLIISIAFVSFSLVIISLVMYSREISADSDNPFLGNFTAVVFLLSGVINLSGGNYFSAAISMYDTVPGDAILAFVIGSVEFGANDILFGIGFITLGRAIRDVNNKLEPAILLNIISFGALIIGIVNIVNVFIANDNVGLISWLAWVLISVLLGISIIRSKKTS
jgi:hypothetical protein|tara:strand:+ start:497 stop:1138 length:642 start_codon:yes stop_codon:yes gene_type:complete